MKTERGFLLVLLCAVINTFEAVLPRSLKEYNQSEAFSNSSVAFNATTEHTVEFPDDVQVRCKPLRAKRYLSDGHCTSVKPIREVVCVGQCLPLKEQNLPWWTEFINAGNKLKEWRCVEDVIKRRRVRLFCKNGQIRTYRIKVVKSCKCEEFKRQNNRTNTRKRRKNRQRKRDRRRRHRRNRNKKQNRKSKSLLTSAVKQS